MTGPGTLAQAETGGERRARRSGAFWSLIVAVPTIIWLMRLWVEAGGQLQTMLFLVSNAGATNLLTTVFVTALPALTGVTVAVLTLGRMLDRPAAAQGAAGASFARWSGSAPVWFLLLTFAFAVATWRIVHLPLLAAAMVIVVQPWLPNRPARAVVVIGGLLATGALGLVLLPTIAAAGAPDELLPRLLLGVPTALLLVLLPALWFEVDLTLPGPRRLACLIEPLVLIAGCWAVLPVTSTPVLPTTVTTLAGQSVPSGAAAPSGAAPGVEGTGGVSEEPPTVSIRGSVVGADDRLTAVLQENGGVVFEVNEDITGRILCPGAQEIPRYDLWVHRLHIEDSLLEAWGRRVRPAGPVDAACRRG